MSDLRAVFAAAVAAGRDPAALWPAARDFLGEEAATEICGPKPTVIVPLLHNHHTLASHIGPGTELMALLKSEGFEEMPSCNCKSKSRQMDSWGVTGCQEHKEEIVVWLVEAVRKAGYQEGPNELVPLEAIAGALVDEAIRRAKAKQA